jgi:hypothetical protein
MEEFKSAYPVLPAQFLQIEGSVLKRCTITGNREYAVRIPDGVTEIGGIGEGISVTGAFQDCTGLRAVYIPGSVTAIGKYAFLDCTALTQVAIPGSVTAIGALADKVPDKSNWGVYGYSIQNKPNDLDAPVWKLPVYMAVCIEILTAEYDTAKRRSMRWVS